MIMLCGKDARIGINVNPRKEKSDPIGSPSRIGKLFSWIHNLPRSYKLHWKQCEQCRVKKNVHKNYASGFASK